MSSIKERRIALTTRMNELEHRLHDIDDALESHNSRDWQELAIEREEDEVLEGMGISGVEEIRAITAALERMDAGEYGQCVGCGADISSERLDILPYTPFCRTCAAKNAKKH